MPPELLAPLSHLAWLLLGYLTGRLLRLAAHLRHQFDYSWQDALRDALRLLFDFKF